jgi:site-specific DNA-methyltransferase (adenine-specific)
MIKITNEDNMELMARYENNHFDLAIVDPPYGIGFGAFNRTNKASDGTRVKADKYKNSNWDDGIPDETYFKELFRVSKNQIIWGGNYFPFIWGYGGKGFIYWHKGNPVPNFADGELAWTSFNKVAKQFNYRYYGNLEGNTSASEKHHPTQKPIALYEWLLMNYAKEGDKILDTHLGSGSIALACHNLNYNLTACELDTEYYNAAIKRLKEHQQQLTMF